LNSIVQEHVALLEPSRRRMLIMPLVILMAGGAIAYWTSVTRERSRRQVVDQVTQLVQDVCAGGDVTLPLDPAAAPVEPQILEELRKTCSAGNALNIQASTGDAQHIGRTSGAATHLALVRSGEQVVLVLRVRVDADGRLTLLGYITPQANGP
jgi:hypothetical protein